MKDTPKKARVVQIIFLMWIANKPTWDAKIVIWAMKRGDAELQEIIFASSCLHKHI